MNQTDKLKMLFPIGTKYSAYRDRSSRNWEYDFRNMKDCGMDTVRVHATWGTIEPSEGEFDFSYYDAILETAVKHGLQVIFTLYLVCTPEWVYEKHPDSRYVSAAGSFGHPISRQMLQQADGRDCVWTVNRIGKPSRILSGHLQSIIREMKILQLLMYSMNRRRAFPAVLPK